MPMCMIVVKDKGVKLPKDEYLKNGASKNSDGIGICYRKKGEKKVTIKKDFKDVNALNKWLKENIGEEDQLIIHFRLATSGKRDAGNRHPFPITENKLLLRKNNLKKRFAVAHNGVINKYYGSNQKY